MTNASCIAAAALPATVGAPQVLLPAGRFDAPRGALLGTGPWHLSETRGAALAEALRRRHSDLPIDYEHQTLRAASNGHPAPAAGWVHPDDLSFVPGTGLVATTVHWTERAAAHIAAGEYRYLSPVFSYTDDGEVRDLLHASLVNVPALDLPEVALAAAARSILYSTEIAAMSQMEGELRERLIYMLNLPLTTSDTDLIAALDQLKSMLTSASPDSQAAASLPVLLTTQGERIAALTAQLAAAPKADLVADLQREIADLRNTREREQRETLLAAALADGRLLPGGPLHQFAAGLPLDGLQALLPALAPIAALSGSQTQGQAPAAVAVAAAAQQAADLDAFGGSQELKDAHDRALAAGRVQIYGVTTP